MILNLKISKWKISRLVINLEKEIEIGGMKMSSLGRACNSIITAVICKEISNLIRIQKINKV